MPYHHIIHLSTLNVRAFPLSHPSSLLHAGDAAMIASHSFRRSCYFVLDSNFDGGESVSSLHIKCVVTPLEAHEAVDACCPHARKLTVARCIYPAGRVPSGSDVFFLRHPQGVKVDNMTFSPCPHLVSIFAVGAGHEQNITVTPSTHKVAPRKHTRKKRNEVGQK